MLKKHSILFDNAKDIILYTKYFISQRIDARYLLHTNNNIYKLRGESIEYNFINKKS